jgi:hypothetical protein
MEYEGYGFLFVPVEGGKGDKREPAIIAVFRASNLEYVDQEYVYPSGEKHAPWCAVDPAAPDSEGFIYLYSSSFKNVRAFYKYKIDWEELKDNKRLVMEKVGSFPIVDESGHSLTLNYMQGGVFSKSGNLLYITNGYHEGGGDWGIHVFDMETGWRVRKSSNKHRPFKYEFHPNWPNYQEPEGITIWDLGDEWGQLHVIMLQWEAGDDALYFKHYTHTIHVDRKYSGISGIEEGTPTKPFNTISEANDYAWNGAQIKIHAGSYPESVTFSKRLKVLTKGGTVVIGK